MTAHTVHAFILACALGACVPPTKHVDGGEWTDGAAGSPSRTDACSGSACTVCTTFAQCTGNPSTPVCDTATSTCVQCNSDADCPTPGAAKCDASSHACVPCDADAQCAHIEVGGNDNLDVCHAGTCVACTPETEASECGDAACDPDELECTQRVRGSVATCGTCRADSECAANHKCIRVPFGENGEIDTGYHCMQQIPSQGCPRPFQGPRLSATSKNGVSSPPQYCAHNTNVTTCEAILSLISPTPPDKTCTAQTVESDCGQGARCAAISAGPNRCTYSCASDAVCPSDFPCNQENGLEPNPYCGGPAI